MANHDTHRGRDPRDQELFGPATLASLRTAVDELSWLLGRGYSQRAALKLVGDRRALHARQRLAVLRCACGDAQRASRHARRIEIDRLRDRELAIDGFNCLITAEAALAGALVIRGRDGVLRDLASVHGRYRTVAETEPAIRAMQAVLTAAAPSTVQVFLDRPVSHSGQLAQLMKTIAPPWQIVLTSNPDRALRSLPTAIAASSDSAILDRCGPWFPLSNAIISTHAPSAWIVDLSS